MQPTAAIPSAAHSTFPHVTRSGSDAQSDVAICSGDELAQSRGVHVLPAAELDVPHAPAGAFEKAGRVVELGAEKEADVRMGTEGVDVAEGRVFHTGCGMAVVKKLANVSPASAHFVEPSPGELSQLVVGLRKPVSDRLVSPDGAREPEEIAHPPILSRLRNMARRKQSRLPLRTRTAFRRNPAQIKTAAAENRDGCFLVRALNWTNEIS